MFSLIFKIINCEESVLIPVMQCSFREYTNAAGTWVDCWHDGKLYQLDTTISEIIRVSNNQIPPNLHTPTEHKHLRGFSGV